MSRIRNMSRGGWIVIGILVATMLVPSGVAVAKVLKFAGLEGTSGNKADVTPAQQLLTAEALPSAYQDYVGYQITSGNIDQPFCGEIANPIPAGDSFIAQQVNVDVFGSQPTTKQSIWTNTSNASYNIFVDPPSSGCGASGNVIASGDAPGGSVGNTSIPLVPGVVVPSGYKLDAAVVGLGINVYVTGYLVPSADAPASPHIQTNGKIALPHSP